ncbi:MAG: GNAT family N-acetyltransferase [Casimicrobiaceae bacterium]
MTTAFAVRTARWPEDADLLQSLRHDVFVVEQGVPATLEWDGIDARCVHALAVASDGTAVGCGRLLPDGHIGRMAVLRPWRGRGVGGALLVHLVDLARHRGESSVVLNAQTHAVDFYRRHGFVPLGPTFMEAGIPHQAMQRPLA